jgi:hypothetical protein
MLVAMCAFVVGDHITNETLTVEYDVLYARAAIVYEGDIDQRFYMTRIALIKSAPTFIGKPVLMGHEWADPYACVGEIISVSVAFDDELNRYYIEAIFIIRDREAIIRTTKGLFKRLSIGSEFIDIRCSIDSKDMLTCGHVPGQHELVNGKTVTAIGVIYQLSGLETSFVNVPASVPSRILELSYSPFEISVSN